MEGDTTAVVFLRGTPVSSGLARGPQTLHDTALGWRLINPRMAEAYSTEAMGETAENVAERYSVSREDQDLRRTA